jgi:diacylglycerol kinase (ATP)
MQTTLILNPYAGRWKAQRERQHLEAALRDYGLQARILESQAPGQVVELAQQAAESGEGPILVAGGDGTISEVVNGLFRAHPEGPLGPIGVLPLGTANDLAINLGLPQTLPEAVAAIRGGRTRRIDLGRANEWVFDNNSAVGLEPVVTLYNIRMRRLKGIVRYLVAALRAIADKGEWNMSIEWDDGRVEGPMSLVSVGNCPLTGGLFRMAPAADPSDGLLTFVYGYAPTRRKMLSLLPRTLSGSFVNDPAIHQFHTRRLVITSQPPTPLQVDGELRSEGIQRVEYEALPGRLDVFVP